MENMEYLDIKKKLYAYYELFNKVYAVVTKNENVKFGKKNKALFSSDPLFRFLYSVHLSTKEEIDEDVKLTDKGVIVPELKDSYCNFKIGNYHCSPDSKDAVSIDPYYLMWKEQVNSYFDELGELMLEYFGITIDEETKEITRNLIPISSHPYQSFIDINKKVVKLKRRARLIRILIENSPTISKQPIRGKDEEVKKIYYSIRCNWIDDCGEVEFKRLIRIPDEVGEVNVVEKDIFESDKKSDRKEKRLVADNFYPAMFSEDLFDVLSVPGYIFRQEYNKNVYPYETKYIMIDENGNENNLCFAGKHLTLGKVLSILEFGDSYEEFMESIKNENRQKQNR